MLKRIIFIFSILIGLHSALGQKLGIEKSLFFNPNEAESMLFLFNQTTIKGSEVVTYGPLGLKLKAGLKQARALAADSTKADSVKIDELNLKPAEVVLCLTIISISQIEAKYAVLVLGMKEKLEALLFQPKERKSKRLK